MKRKCSSPGANDDDDDDVVIVEDAIDKIPWVKNRLVWLSSDVMNESQELMAKQFSGEWQGFQNTALGPALQFIVVRRKNLQIINLSNIHWVATTSDENGKVFLFDSLFSGRLSNSLQQQLAALYRTDEDYLDVNVVQVQQQQGGSDCGPFSVAFLVEVALGNDPEKFTFQQAALRNHLAHCLNKGHFTSFPKKSRRPGIERREK